MSEKETNEGTAATLFARAGSCARPFRACREAAAAEHGSRVSSSPSHAEHADPVLCPSSLARGPRLRLLCSRGSAPKVASDEPAHLGSNEENPRRRVVLE